MPDATLNQIRAFFNIESAQKFTAEWQKLTDADKAQIRAGIGDGTYNY